MLELLSTDEFDNFFTIHHNHSLFRLSSFNAVTYDGLPFHTFCCLSLLIRIGGRYLMYVASHFAQTP